MLWIPTRRQRSDGPNSRRCYRLALEPLEDRVALSISATSLAPSNGATGVNIDTPLAITFDQVPVIGTGSIVVHNADGSVADTLTLAPGSSPTNIPNLIAGATSLHTTIGGSNPIVYYQVFINTATDTATLYLHKALAYGQAYYVTMDPGAFTDAAGDQSAAISDPNAWRFSTKASAPAAGTTRLTVAADGTGDFSTVQGAIDFVPVGNAQRVFILVRNGTYTEIDNISRDKPFITIYGEDRDQSVIQYPNNNNLQITNPLGAHTNNRFLFNDEASDFTLANITLHNITPDGGSQAEAFRGNNQRIVIDGVNLESFQDTLLDNTGTEYIANSFIAGDVDFMWGTGAGYFLNDELQAVASGGWYTQVRNAGTASFNSPGFVYVNCRFTRADAGVTGSYLGRIDPNSWPFSQMVLINCQLDPNIAPVGWDPTIAFTNDVPITTAPFVRLWEYNSTDPNGNPIDVSQRAFFSSRISAELARRWSSVPFVLAGWVPDLTSVLPPGPAAHGRETRAMTGDDRATRPRP